MLITGANRGLGLAFVQALATCTPTDHFLLGCRAVSAGEAAIQQLRGLGVTAAIEALQLDVTSDTSLGAAVAHVPGKFGRLDVLVNNAGMALIPPSVGVQGEEEEPGRSDFPGYRHALRGRVRHERHVRRAVHGALPAASVLFISRGPRRSRGGGGIVINVSSGRASLGIATSGKMPPTVSVPYSVSKTALNALTVEMARDPANARVRFQCVSPRHCRTEFNGFRGTWEPLEGANVVVKLVNHEEGRYANAGFGQTYGASTDCLCSDSLVGGKGGLRVDRLGRGQILWLMPTG